MIKWDLLYNKLLIDRRYEGEGCQWHHSIPIHAGGKDSELVPLKYSDHILAHFILYKMNGNYKDQLAYKLMSNQIKHNTEFIEIRQQISKKAKERWNDSLEREKQSIRRKEYFLNNPDKMQKQVELLNSPESKEKARQTYKQYVLNNKEIIISRMQIIARNTIEKNKLLSNEERIRKYSRGDHNNNPNWKGYCYLILGDMIIRKYLSAIDMDNNVDLHRSTIDFYIQTGNTIQRGEFKGYKIIRSKEEL